MTRAMRTARTSAKNTHWMFLPLVLPGVLAAANADILNIVIDGPLDIPLPKNLSSAHHCRGETGNASALLIQLRNPGGLADSTRQIMTESSNPRRLVIIYVAPSGARAASAGFFILESADIAAMAPGTNTGAAHPDAWAGAR